ncbi:ATPase [Streptomyces sp. 8K308]|nr:ATPase [Streptomyces sp. 8K308]
MAVPPIIRRTITVDVPIDRAFRFFTESFSAWWPPEYRIGAVQPSEAVLEPRGGGRWFERAPDGTECGWGHVRVWQPPERLVLTWQITGEWRYDGDPDHASEVEIRFTAVGSGVTKVDLEHRLLERLVGGESVHDAVGGDAGWHAVLRRFARSATKPPGAV